MSPPETIETLERARQELQRALDTRPRVERNRLGQYATPPALARELVALGLAALPPGQPVSFLDPALGSGAFYAALLASLGDRPLERALGVELDPQVATRTAELWAGHPLRILNADFTTLAPPDQPYNLLIANPPYVRHHHLEPSAKLALSGRVRQATGLHLSQLAGLHCHFLLLSRAWISPGGVGVWLIPSGLLDVAYGETVRRFLREQVTLLRLHRADPRDALFQDALVSSVVLVLRYGPPPAGHRVLFSEGGSLSAPERLREVELDALRADKWTGLATEPGPAPEPGSDELGPTLGDLFTIRRGLATGGNTFFVLDEARARELPADQLVPILPPPRRLRADRVDPLLDGSPDLPIRSWLLCCTLPEPEVAARHPALWRYLQSGVPDVSSGYLCSRRSPWYAQERRPPAPLLCTYMGRGTDGRPFRFILNRSLATASNVYLLLYPRPALQAAIDADPGLLERLWQQLRALSPETLTGRGRVYGGGLHKLEPAELARVRVPAGLLR